jgi:hypothetical protein
LLDSDCSAVVKDIRYLGGVAAARGFRAQLVLDEHVERTVDAGGGDGRAEAAATDLDLVGALGDVTGRLRVGDIRRDDRKRRLVGA